MQLIGKSKIGKLVAEGIAYPQLYLPPEYSDVIRQVADVIETRHDGKRALLMVPSDSTGLKPSLKVLKLASEIEVNDRLSKLQSAFKTIKTALFDNECGALTKTKKRASLIGSAGFGPATCAV
jgi:hypothetical protein